MLRKYGHDSQKRKKEEERDVCVEAGRGQSAPISAHHTTLYAVVIGLVQSVYDRHFPVDVLPKLDPEPHRIFMSLCFGDGKNSLRERPTFAAVGRSFFYVRDLVLPCLSLLQER